MERYEYFNNLITKECNKINGTQCIGLGWNNNIKVLGNLFKMSYVCSNKKIPQILKNTPKGKKKIPRLTLLLIPQ